MTTSQDQHYIYMNFHYLVTMPVVMGYFNITRCGHTHTHTHTHIGVLFLHNLPRMVM